MRSVEPKHGELPLRLPGDRGVVILRWRDTNVGPFGSLWYGDRQLVVSTSIDMTRDCVRHLTENVGVVELPCRELLDTLPPDGGVLAPKPHRGLTGVALLNRSREVPANTTEWVLESGRSANGVTYNTHLIAHCKVELEIDLANMLAYYYETSSFDDG